MPRPEDVMFRPEDVITLLEDARAIAKEIKPESPKQMEMLIEAEAEVLRAIKKFERLADGERP